MVTVSLRLDEATKQGLDQMCGEMGMNLTTFFMIYAKAALRERKIPFEIRANDEYKYDFSSRSPLLRDIEWSC